MASPAGLDTATLAAGCFWCVEAVFNDMKGVQKAVSGYMGGHVKNPTYEQVCEGDTGHAEAVQVTYDPATITFDKLLDIFFTVHDPTQLNRQGNDIGTQYRSAIFYHSPEQRSAAEAKIKALNDSGKFGAPIVTQVVPATTWFSAEGYHQEYFRNNPSQPYCRNVVAAKVRKAHAAFPDKLK